MKKLKEEYQKWEKAIERQNALKSGGVLMEKLD